MAHEWLAKVARDEPLVYRIELQGPLDPSWAEAVGDMAITIAQYENGSTVTTLTGRLADQAALAGVINLALSLGLPLLSVNCLGRAG